MTQRTSRSASPRGPGESPAARAEVTSTAAARRAGEQRGPAGPGRWLGLSLAALAVLAGAAAAVSFSAQYQMVRAAKGGAVVSGLEAGIPDAAAVVFAALGIALALHGRRAIRVRVLNLAAVGTSVAMNVLAAGHGWRNLAIWVMPPAAYALTSDTAIGVIRALAAARHRGPGTALADDGATPLALAGGLVVWLLRLALAPASTLAGFRRWVIEECPVAPGRRAPGPACPPAAAAAPGRRQPAAANQPPGGGIVRAGTKTARFLDLVTGRHGPLAQFPLAEVSRVCAELAPAADLHPGAARAALRRHVLAAQAAASPSEISPCENGSPS